MSVVILFRSRLRPEAHEVYLPVAERMETLARSQPGFVAFKTFAAPDGERLSVAEFESDAHAAAWRRDPEHQAAQRRADEFYSTWGIEVLAPVRKVP